MTPTRKFLPSILAIFAILTLSACTEKIYEDPIAVMTNRDAGPDDRLSAIRQADKSSHDDPRRIEALNHVLWDYGYSSEERNLAMDQLLAIDQAKFHDQAARRIVLIQRWDVIAHLMNIVVQRNWTDFTPAIVRNLSGGRGSVDMDRPEIPALKALNPGRPLEEIVFDVFINADDKVGAVHQASAWELLVRLTTPDRLTQLLAKAPDRTPLIVDLKAASADLHLLPIDKETVTWLSTIRTPNHHAFWVAAKARVAALTPDQRRGLELRHLPVLIALDDATLAMDAAALYQSVAASVEPAEHHFRGPTFDGASQDFPQALADYRSQLSWPDLATLHLLTRLFQDNAAIAAFFTQADADKRDVGTEYGGVLSLSNARFTPRPFTPLRLVHDRKYVPPPELMTALYTGVAHYHFHAQEYHNSDYAGPGAGDRENASRIHANCLVLTFIDEDRLNVDYYQAGNIVIDLGTIHRKN